MAQRHESWDHTRCWHNQLAVPTSCVVGWVKAGRLCYKYHKQGGCQGRPVINSVFLSLYPLPFHCIFVSSEPFSWILPFGIPVCHFLDWFYLLSGRGICILKVHVSALKLEAALMCPYLRALAFDGPVRIFPPLQRKAWMK